MPLSALAEPPSQSRPLRSVEIEFLRRSVQHLGAPEDNYSPARGIVLGIALSSFFWAALGLCFLAL